MTGASSQHGGGSPATPVRSPEQMPGRVLPGQPVEDPIPPEMAPEQDLPHPPSPAPED
ncbi:MAG TPA: hypothetical protein VN680_11710 [Burkholderiaceae bacterium]|nr:hypothetical protein [Burkholderiaceae bacterium]